MKEGFNIKEEEGCQQRTGVKEEAYIGGGIKVVVGLWDTEWGGRKCLCRSRPTQIDTKK